MRVSNEPGGGPTGALSELFRLQADFQARLAEETLRYMRRLQGAVVPAAPGTVMMPADGLELRAVGQRGGRAELALEIENLQRVHCMVTPQLTPMVSAAGVTWFPEAEVATASRLLPPSAVERIAIPVTVPPELPDGEYRGALLLQGFRQSTVPVTITIGEKAQRTETTAAAAKKGSAKRRTAVKQGVADDGLGEPPEKSGARKRTRKGGRTSR
jgi:hypothetical protein